MKKLNLWKRTVAGLLSLLIVAGTMPANVGGFLTGGTEIVASAEGTSGEWGNGINYTYDSDTGTLTLTATDSGTVVEQSGVVCYYDGSDRIINDQFSSISKIVISEGITQIDEWAFTDWNDSNGNSFDNDITVEIPSTVTNIQVTTAQIGLKLHQWMPGHTRWVLLLMLAPTMGHQKAF